MRGCATDMRRASRFQLTETGQAACGGDRQASIYIDSFRYLDQLGGLAKRGVKVVMQQHACCQRLRPDRREDADTATELLGRCAVAQHDGHHGSGCGECAGGDGSCVHAVHEEPSGRRDAAGVEPEPDGGADGECA